MSGRWHRLGLQERGEALRGKLEQRGTELATAQARFGGFTAELTALLEKVARLRSDLAAVQAGQPRASRHTGRTAVGGPVYPA